MARHLAARIVGVFLFVCLAAGCTARGPVLTRAQLAAIDRADALVRLGCYTCLQEAFAIYEGLTTPTAPQASTRALRGVFDAALLLAVREKEIGLAPDASLARARAVLPRLTPASGDNLATLLKAAETIAGDSSGLDSEERLLKNEAMQSEAAASTAEQLLKALEPIAATNLTAAYLALALTCEQPGDRRRALAPVPADRDSLLMQYRSAICYTGASADRFITLRGADPRWTETFFFEGRFEMGSPARGAQPERAEPLLASAARAFPASVGVHVLLAKAQQMNGKYEDALQGFDRVLGMRPGHVDAQLGRAENLTYLMRASEAIAAATLLIDQGAWHVGDAYYWRAWNRYQTRELDAAWADIQQAMQLRANTAVYALAGSIAQARGELDTAVRHFNRAFDMDPRNCLAAWSAGLVLMEQAARQPAYERFTKAATCFDGAAAAARTDLERIERSTLEPALKASRASSARKRIESALELAARARAFRDKMAGFQNPSHASASRLRTTRLTTANDGGLSSARHRPRTALPPDRLEAHGADRDDL